MVRTQRLLLLVYLIGKSVAVRSFFAVVALLVFPGKKWSRKSTEKDSLRIHFFSELKLHYLMIIFISSRVMMVERICLLPQQRSSLGGGIPSQVIPDE